MKNYFFKHKGKLALWILGETLYALCMVLWSFFMKSLSDVAFGGALSGINTLLLIGGGYLILFLIVGDVILGSSGVKISVFRHPVHCHHVFFHNDI